MLRGLDSHITGNGGEDLYSMTPEDAMWIEYLEFLDDIADADGTD